MGRRRDYIEVLKTRSGIQTGEFEIFYEKKTKNYFTQTTAPELKAKNDSTCEMDHYPKEGKLQSKLQLRDPELRDIFRKI